MCFAQQCLNSENVLGNFVSRHAVFALVYGRKVQFCCERFDTSGGSMLGSGGTGVPNLAQPPIFNWFCSNVA